MKNPARLPLLAAACAASALLALPVALPAQTPTFGTPELVMTAAETQAAGIAFWDGTFGITRYSSTEFSFYHTQHVHTVKMRGTPSSPNNTVLWKKHQSQLWNMNGYYGVPWITAMYDPNDGSLDRYAFIHVEHANAAGNQWPGAIGLAYSADGGATWKYAGDSIRLDSASTPTNLGGAQYTQDGAYFYIYYKEAYCRAVARCAIGTALANAKAGTPANFKKFYNAAWNEPGMGGRASDNGLGSLIGTGHGDITYHSRIGKYVYAAVDVIADGNRLVLLTSSSVTGPWTPFYRANPDGAGGGALHYVTICPITNNLDNGRTDTVGFHVYASQHAVGQAVGQRLWRVLVTFP